MKTRYLLLALLLAAVVGCGGGDYESGDRVLVSKFAYDGLKPPNRFDVVVFKYPERPTREHTPTNYIKRLIGLAGETIAIFFGNLYRYNPSSQPAGDSPLKYPTDEGVAAVDLWKKEFMHENFAPAVELFERGRFEIIRKTPSVLLAMRRIVNDNDFPAKDLQDVLPARWQGVEPKGWVSDGGNGFRHEGSETKVDWLRYKHILRPNDWPMMPDKQRVAPDVAALMIQDAAPKIAEIKQRKHEPQLITDFEAYNRYELPGDPRPPSPNWVGSLMLDCKVTVTKPEGELWLELSKSAERYRAKFDLKTGLCTLYRVEKLVPENVRMADWVEEMGTGRDEKLKDLGTDKEIGSATTRLSKPGTYEVKFADADDRLIVWVDRDLPFGPGVDFIDSPKKRGPTPNDLQPASIGFKGPSGAVQVLNLKLWRDTYYTVSNPPSGDAPAPAGMQGSYWNNPESWEHPSQWGNEQWRSLGDLRVKTLYVQPGHYLCLGDNSPESSDGRTWGLVPERLLLGRALLVYYPFDRAQVIK